MTCLVALNLLNTASLEVLQNQIVPIIKEIKPNPVKRQLVHPDVGFQ